MQPNCDRFQAHGLRLQAMCSQAELHEPNLNMFYIFFNDGLLNMCIEEVFE